MTTKSQGTLLKVETTRAATKTITGITAANPPVVTATAHGYTNGDIIALANIGGMVQLNDRVFVIANIAANTFELRGVNALAYTAYTSLGDSYKLTMTVVGKVRNFSAPGSASADIDATHLQSLRMEKLTGLADDGDYSFGVVLEPTDTGQTALQTSQDNQTILGFTLTQPGGLIACFSAGVKQFGYTANTNGIYEGNVTLTLRAAAARFA